jgi:pyruvate dehydrogenase E2 component (dihydrolipoamide acetyltransferase)
VAIVGFGRVAERPVVVDSRVVARPQVTVTLAADHRASDGHLGGQLLSAIDRALQSPATL